MLGRLERTPAGLHGDWWRTFTSLFVQDGGVIGTLSNLVFLAVIGAIAEQVISRPRWLAHYSGVGLLAEFAGYAWQPVGGGNSGAVCGLAGAVALGCWRADPRLPGYAPQALLLWCGALLGTLSGWLLAPMIVAAGAAGALARGQQQRRLVRVAVPLAAVATGAVLAAFSNIHGAALLAGLLLALATARGPGQTRAPEARTAAG
jgi:membrane associated rhomboid family serine protease